MPSRRIAQILIQAIADELDAYDFYFCMVDKVEDEEAKRIYHCLANEELQHRDTLQSILESEITTRFKLSEDIIAFDEEPMPRVSPDMGPLEALRLAIKREAMAMEDYSVLAQLSKSADQQAVFENLVRMEHDHKVKLERIYEKMSGKRSAE